MNRLKHSPAAFIRKLQMSRSKIHVVIEGRKSDSYVYGQICRKLDPSSFFYQLIRSEELPTQGSGKQHLLAYFMYLRRRNSLKIDFKGQKSVVTFILDKDIDDLHRIKKRSAHVIYTRYYDIENYIFRHGNFIKAIAAACSEDPSRVERKFLAPEQWSELAADRWREWVALCVLAARYKIKRVANYSAGSPINKGFAGNLDMVKYRNKLEELRIASGLSSADFESLHKRMRSKVGQLYRDGRADEVFKGKWYALQMCEEVRLEIEGAAKLWACGNSC